MNGPLMECIMAAMYGPEKKFLRIFDHEFHSKPMTRVAAPDGGTLFTGQLSHQLSLRPDDQFYYQFVVRDGLLVKDSITTRIEDGGFDPLVGLAASAVGSYFGVPVSSEDAAKVWDKLANAFVGKGWREVANMIVASVAMQAAAVASLPKGLSIQHVSSGRFLDAYQSGDKDFRLVTRSKQSDDSQQWILKLLGNNTYTLQQKSTGLYVDAHESVEQDYALVTRAAQGNSTQQWMLKSLGNDLYTIQQKSNGRYVDAHENAEKDFQVVTRPAQNNSTQKWRLKLT